MQQSLFPESLSIDLSKFLQSPRPTRWVASRKVAVVVAVRLGLLSTSEACERYLLSVDELARWKVVFETEGRTGLHLKRMTERRHARAVFPQYGLLRVEGPGKRQRRTEVTPSASFPDVSDLTPKEYAILELLARNINEVISKEILHNHLYGENGPGIKIIDVFVCKLRRKLAKIPEEKHRIETVWGRGYKLHETPVACLVPKPKLRPSPAA